MTVVMHCPQQYFCEKWTKGNASTVSGTKQDVFPRCHSTAGSEVTPKPFRLIDHVALLTCSTEASLRKECKYYAKFINLKNGLTYNKQEALQ